jgi:hypothetical protein
VFLRGGPAELRVRLAPWHAARLLATWPGPAWRAAPALGDPSRLLATRCGSHAGLASRLALLEEECALQSLSLAAAGAGVAACIIGTDSASRFTTCSRRAAEPAAPIA